MIAVRWRVPPGLDDGGRLSFLETYAGVLRGAGIRAFVTLAAPEARVVCLSDPGQLLAGRCTVAPTMERAAHPRDPTVVLTAGRVLDVVASGLVLEGTVDELAGQLGVGAGPLRVALRELRRVGWVAVRIWPPGRLLVRLERRLPDHQVPVATERRQTGEDAWAL